MKHYLPKKIVKMYEHYKAIFSKLLVSVGSRYVRYENGSNENKIY